MKKRNTLTIICLDFYGLPGSGKSTISHLYAAKLKHIYDVREPSYHYDHECSKISRMILKSSEVIKLFVFSFRLFWRICIILKECNHFPTCKTFYINLLNLAYKFNALNRRNNSVAIFDQGFLQSVLSMYFRDTNVNETVVLKTYKKLTQLFPKEVDIRNVYIRTDIDTAIERMSNRHTNVSRVQGLDLAEMKKELAIQKSIFDLAPHSIAIDSGKLSAGDCVEILFKKMNIF